MFTKLAVGCLSRRRGIHAAIYRFKRGDVFLGHAELARVGV